MSYYGYVARDVKDQINWAKIGTDFADMLYKGEEDREKKRKEIDAETDKVIKLINESPTGLSKSLSDWSLDFGSKAKNQMLMLNRELKAGRLNPDKFIKYRQNISDGTKGIYETMDRFKKYGAEVEERIRKGVASEAERWSWSTVEKLGRFSESAAYINPTDSNVYIAPLKDGKIDTDPNNIMSPAALNRMLETKYDRFDILGSSKKIADAAAKDIRVVNKGGIKTISNILQRPGFDEKDPSKLDPTTKLYLQLENDAVNAALYTDEVSMSVLVDGRQVNKRTGNVYDFTTDEKDPGIKTGDKVYMKFNPGTSKYEPVLTEEQKEDARNVLKASIRYQLPYEETPMAERQASTGGGGGKTRGGTEEDKVATTMLRYLYSGNDAQMQQARNYFQDRGYSVTRTPNGVDVVKQDKEGNRRTFSLPFTTPQGEVLDEIGWAASAGPILASERDVSEVLRYGGKGGALGRLNTTTSFSTAPAAGSSKRDQWIKQYNKLLPGGTKLKGGTDENAANTAAILSSKFGQFDFTFTTDGEIIEVETPSAGKIRVDTGKEGFVKILTDAIKNGLGGERLKATTFNK
jgi:hypothetical protein